MVKDSKDNAQADPYTAMCARLGPAAVAAAVASAKAAPPFTDRQLAELAVLLRDPPRPARPAES